MNRRITDSLLILVLLALPLLGFAQACGSNPPPWPGLPPENGDGNGDNGGDDGNGEPPPPPPENHAPVAVLSVVGTEEGPTPFTVQLDGSASYDPDDDQLAYLWLLSDGGTHSESVVEHEFTSSGRYQARLVVTDPGGLANEAGPVTLFSWGLANSPWPKFACDERNSGLSPNIGPMMDFEHADEGGAFPRYWRGGINNDTVKAVCIGYQGMVIYTQGEWLRARTQSGGVLWDTEVESEITAWPAIAHNGSIVFGTYDGYVHKVRVTGDIAWSLNVSDVIGGPLILDTAATIDGNGTSYLGGYLDVPSLPDEERGRFIAVSFDGDLLWIRVIPFHGYRPVPALSGMGNVIVNAREGREFNPAGDLVNTYQVQSYSVVPKALGPPAVDKDGLVAFSDTYLPVFLPNGNLIREMMNPSWGWPSYYFQNEEPGAMQAPVWGDQAIDLVTGNYYDVYLNTRTQQGDLSQLQLKTTFTSGAPNMPGACQDALGRVYVSCYGIHAASPVRYYSVIPYRRRYSLWSYDRPAKYMSAPAIGEDGWLYVGCDDDIMALGE